MEADGAGEEPFEGAVHDGLVNLMDLKGVAGGAGLGLQLYDGLHGTQTGWVYERWIEYARKHYMGLDSKGRLDWFAFYYDPLERSMCTLRDDVGAGPGPGIGQCVEVRGHGVQAAERVRDEHHGDVPERGTTVGPHTPAHARLRFEERYGSLWTLGLKGTF